MQQMSGLQVAIELAAALGALGAAAFAAWSAWISKTSADTAKEGVEEARRARKAQLSPRLILEKDFLSLDLRWPSLIPQRGLPDFNARKGYQATDPVTPTFSLTNHGESPALEVQVIFNLHDPNGGLEVPDRFAPLGLSIEHEECDSGGTLTTLWFIPPSSQGGSGMPLYKRWAADFANCAPGQTRTVEFPEHLLGRLFLRGLQNSGKRSYGPGSIKPVELVVMIKAHTLDGEPYQTQFRFTAHPFWTGDPYQLRVSAHFSELPMYPVDKDERRPVT